MKNALTIFLIWTFVAIGMTSVQTQARQFDTDVTDLFSDEPEFLPVEEAFIFDFAQQDGVLTLKWEIADGYYLYKKQYKYVEKSVSVSEATFNSESIQIEDEYFGISDVFYEELALQHSINWAKQDGSVKIRYQGCAEAGLCYPPTTKIVYLTKVGEPPVENDAPATANTEAATNTNLDNASSVDRSSISEQFQLQELLSGDQHLALTLLLFVALGVGLAFTPCVFPMYPIISSIVVGQGDKVKTSRVLTLSFFYVQGMAIMYSLIGLVVASAGVQFQAALQADWVLITFIIIFSALAFVMFGAYELQLPSSWQVKLNNMSNQQKGGSYFGVFMMGAISGLVASPCTTAPLTGILLFIAQSGDLLLGFTALYALSLGMGIPLILFAVTGGKLLPKAGNWMNIVKVTFGFMMMAVALMFLERMMENLWTNLAWAILGLSMFGYFYVMNVDSKSTLWKGVRSVVIFLGLFASAMWAYEHIRPQPTHSAVAGQTLSAKGHPEFMVVRDLADFEQKVAAANAQGQTVMIDLYADWCVACKEFEKYTFTDAGVQDALSNTVWMQIDLTDNTPQSLEFQDAFAILGLPTIMFFDTSGNEIDSARVTGFMKAKPFEAHVRKAL